MCQKRMLYRCQSINIDSQRQEVITLQSWIPPSDIRLNRTCIGQARMSPRESRSQTPIPQVPQVPFENRVDGQLLGSFLGEQSIRRLVGPIQRQGRRVRDEEVVERNARMDLHQFIAHAGPGQIVHPSRVRSEELRRPGGDPIGQSLVILLCG